MYIELAPTGAAEAELDHSQCLQKFLSLSSCP